ncbi:MAG: nucleotidyltransferase domain-containing protein [Spirochaetales bacterium]|nr:nucleotidyltransferase domain-containing protein [Spirochaetales bacterium]
MERDELIGRIRDVLGTTSLSVEVSFAVLFGSHARSSAGPLSDVDVGLYCDTPLDLLELGALVGRLEDEVDSRVDVVELYGLWDRDSAFAHRIASEMQLIMCASRTALTTYRKRTILTYLDTAYLRALSRRALQRRIRAGKLGYRDYV